MNDLTRAAAREPAPATLDPLLELIERLRVDCPWDRELSLARLRPYLIEEAHELAAAIDERDPAAIREELGDLLFEAVYVAHLASEELGTAADQRTSPGATTGATTEGGSSLSMQAAFHEERQHRERAHCDGQPEGSAPGSEAPFAPHPTQPALRDAIDSVNRKMVARHPHVFGGETASSAAEVAALWEQRKKDRAGGSVLDGVPASLPALVGAYRLGQKAAGIGFDWHSASAVRTKVTEELAELDHETGEETGRDDADDASARRVEEELGDVLFAVANLARHLDVDPERALALANRKFRQRFAVVEAEADAAPDGETDDARRQRLERLWERAKRKESGQSA